MNWLMMDSFSHTYKWIAPKTNGLNGGLQWSCETEVSHMGKKPISYRLRWEKKISHYRIKYFIQHGKRRHYENTPIQIY